MPVFVQPADTAMEDAQRSIRAVSGVRSEGEVRQGFPLPKSLAAASSAAAAVTPFAHSTANAVPLPSAASPQIRCSGATKA